MSESERNAFLERQVAFLEEERDAALEALDMAGDLGSFALHSRGRDTRDELVREICARANRMLPFQAVSLYLADEATGDFVRALTDPPQAAGELDDEVRSLIADQSFAHVLQSGDTAFFLGSDRTSQLLLRPLATRTRALGMFAGRLMERKDRISDIALKLFAVVMQSAAHALENQEMREAMEDHARELDRKVQARTADLVEAFERMRTTVDGMQAGVLLIEPESRTIVDVNPEALRLVGLPRDRVVGRRCTEYFCPAQENACPVLDNGQSVDSAERVMKNASGETIPILKTVSRVMVGGRQHLVESFIDITQQKKLETLREDVDRIMRHDLKGPLNGIIGLPAMLLAGGDNLTAEQVEGLRFIRDAGTKLLRMINMSLDLYKMEIGTYVYEPGNGDLMDVVRDVATDLRDALRAGGVRLRIRVDGREAGPDESMPLRCEESLLYSLLSNLMKNAVEGSAWDDEVTLDARREEGGVVLALHNAKPVPEAIRDRLFEKYVTEGKKCGTGLGTYSARLIIETMGGSIRCEAAEGLGTTMTVALPDPVE